MVFIRNTSIRLTTSNFEDEWFRGELNENQDMRKQIIDAALEIQESCTNILWTNDVRVFCKEVCADPYGNTMYRIGIHVKFQISPNTPSTIYDCVKNTIEYTIPS